MGSRETPIMQKVHLALGERPDVRLWRQNVGAARARGSGRLVRFGFTGQPDLWGLVKVGPVAIALFVETKAAGGRLSAEQRAFRDIAQSFGAIYLVARSAAEALEQLDAELHRIRPFINQLPPEGRVGRD